MQRIISRSHFDSLKGLIHVLAASVEMGLHHSCGERYTGMMVRALFLCTVFALLAPALFAAVSSPLLPCYVAALFVRLLAHWLSLRNRRTNVHIDSFSSGYSWAFWSRWPLSARFIHGWIEPLLCVGIGTVVSLIDQPLSLWLIVAGLALFVKTHWLWREGRVRVLDALDGRAGARDLNNAIQDRSQSRSTAPEEATPVTVPLTNAPPRSLASIYQNLDPALQRLMQDNTGTNQPIQQTSPMKAGPTPADVSAPASPRRAMPQGWFGSPHSPTPAADSATAQPAPVQMGARDAIRSADPGRSVRPAGWFGTPSAPTPVASSVSTEPAPVRMTTEIPMTPRRPVGWFGTPSCLSLAPDSVAPPAIVDPHLSEPTPIRKASDVPNPSVDESCDPSRGTEEHESVRQRLQDAAQGLGFQVGLQPNDFILRKGNLALAVEIIVGTSTSGGLENVKKCLAAGLPRVAVVSSKPERLKEMAEAVHSGLPLADGLKVSFHTPEEFVTEMQKLAQAIQQPEPTTSKKRPSRDSPILTDD